MLIFILIAVRVFLYATQTCFEKWSLDMKIVIFYMNRGIIIKCRCPVTLYFP